MDKSTAGVEANARLTSSVAVVLLLLLAAEGATLLRVRALITPHVFIGMLIVPPVLLKIGSVSYRFVKYYAGAPAYRRKGPPPLALRLLGPFVVVVTLVVLGTGIALLFVGVNLRSNLLLLHKVSFVLWFGAMTIHVLGHVLDMARLAPRDYYARTRDQVAGADIRQWMIALSLAVGFLLAALMVARVGHFFAG
jgi:hypothetical protein